MAPRDERKSVGVKDEKAEVRELQAGGKGDVTTVTERRGLAAAASGKIAEAEWAHRTHRKRKIGNVRKKELDGNAGKRKTAGHKSVRGK